jgi:hypothetical protein
VSWDDIKISKEAMEQVKKICYKAWGLNENGERKSDTKR